ncbi:unnamed protein product [Bemisia tabaci]|uniref:Cytochrome P450 n=1 Tax=Bemisia tabaci TaxID=7038 RepID=A0A9P0F2T3_BEMTA|nr:unnamed protein product [Bemisia tabaci]
MSATGSWLHVSPPSSMSGALVWLSATALVLWYFYFRLTRRRLYELAAKIPGFEGFPLIGSAHVLVGNPNAMFETAYSLSFNFKEGTPIKAWFGPRLFVALTDPRDIEIILSSYSHIDKAPEYKFFEPWLGDGLLISTGEKWRAHRKIIAPTFHLNVLKSFMTLFNANCRFTVEKMRVESNEEFDVHHYMSACTVEILLETAMGVDKKTQKASGFAYAMAVMKMCEILHLRHTKLWLRPDFIFGLTGLAKEQIRHLKFIHSLTENVIKKKKEDYRLRKNGLIDVNQNSELKEIENGSATEKTEVVKGSSFGQSAGLTDDLDVDDVGQKRRQAFLDLLVECTEIENVLSDKEMREQVDTIMFEGHDTTAAASSFFLCVMGARPDVQEKVVEELEKIFGDSDRPVTFEDTLEMKYMERCIMETLRLYPPVPMIARQIRQETKLESINAVLPENSTVVIGTFKLHRNSTIYPNPDEFNPDNFLPEVTSTRHYYAFVPFSAGPRSCVGRKYAMLKLKVLLATVLRTFKVHSRTKEREWRLQGDIILKREDGFNISLEPRKMKTKTT